MNIINLNELATVHDPNLKNVTARALVTDGQKINPLSEPVEASIGLRN